MNEDRILFGSLTVLLLILYSCKQYPPPKTELCIAGEFGLFQCNDLRKIKRKQDYERSYPEQTTNYICTNPSDFALVRNYCADLRRDLIKCKKSLDKNSR